MKTQGRRRSSNVVDRRAENYHGKSPALESTANRIQQGRMKSQIDRVRQIQEKVESNANSRNRSSLEEAFRELQRKKK